MVMTLGAVQLMKLANRKVQRRIARGEFPDFLVLSAGSECELELKSPEATAV